MRYHYFRWDVLKRNWFNLVTFPNTLLHLTSFFLHPSVAQCKKRSATGHEAADSIPLRGGRIPMCDGISMGNCCFLDRRNVQNWRQGGSLCYHVCPPICGEARRNELIKELWNWNFSVQYPVWGRTRLFGSTQLFRGLRMPKTPVNGTRLGTLNAKVRDLSSQWRW